LNKFLIVVAVFISPYSNCLSDEITKKSRNAICHDATSPYYFNVKRFKAFDTLEACIKSGGRPPRVRQNTSNSNGTPSPLRHYSHKYSRAKFGRWLDEDKDCQNTRHEILIASSIAPVSMKNTRCKVTKGLWNDLYTGITTHDARELDIDHLVPLKWAWIHGASSWRGEKRSAFANDKNNLFAVTKAINQEKSAQGPLEWMPPNKSFQCPYIRAFTKVMEKYNLTVTNREKDDLESLQLKVCNP